MVIDARKEGTTRIDIKLKYVDSVKHILVDCRGEYQWITIQISYSVYQGAKDV